MLNKITRCRVYRIANTKRTMRIDGGLANTSLGADALIARITTQIKCNAWVRTKCLGRRTHEVRCRVRRGGKGPLRNRTVRKCDGYAWRRRQIRFKTLLRQSAWVRTEDELSLAADIELGVPKVGFGPFRDRQRAYQNDNPQREPCGYPDAGRQRAR